MTSADMSRTFRLRHDRRQSNEKRRGRRVRLRYGTVGGTSVISIECPECAAEINVDSNVEQGEIVPCPECGADLEVLSVGPIVLGLAPEEGEDWGE